jgi:hypothetical protein
MRVEVPGQASTKWWVLLAAVLAAACTCWEHRALLLGEGLPRRPAAAAPRDAGTFVEFEIAP